MWKWTLLLRFFIGDSTFITIFEIFLLLHVRLWTMRWYYISYGYGNDWAMGEVYYYTHIIWWKKRVKLQSLAATDDGVCGVHKCSSPVYFNFIPSEGYFGRWCWCYSAIHTVNIRLNVDKYSTMYDYHTWWHRVIHILDRAIAGRLVFIIEYTRRY